MGSGAPTTPLRAQSLPVHLSDTPVVVKQTSSQSYLHGTLTEARKAVANDAGELIPEVSLDFFFANICPRLRDDIDLDQVVSTLKNDPTRIINRNGRWRVVSRRQTS